MFKYMSIALAFHPIEDFPLRPGANYGQWLTLTYTLSYAESSIEPELKIELEKRSYVHPSTSSLGRPTCKSAYQPACQWSTSLDNYMTVGCWSFVVHRALGYYFGQIKGNPIPVRTPRKL